MTNKKIKLIIIGIIVIMFSKKLSTLKLKRKKEGT